MEDSLESNRSGLPKSAGKGKIKRGFEPPTKLTCDAWGADGWVEDGSMPLRLCRDVTQRRVLWDHTAGRRRPYSNLMVDDGLGCVVLAGHVHCVRRTDGSRYGAP